MMSQDERTIGQLYEPAMKIEDQVEADFYLEWLVRRCMESGKSREEATDIERSNLAYFAGYRSNEKRERVERLFKCAHPIFGAIAEKGAPTLEEAFEMGKKFAQQCAIKSQEKNEPTT